MYSQTTLQFIMTRKIDENSNKIVLLGKIRIGQPTTKKNFLF